MKPEFKVLAVLYFIIFHFVQAVLLAQDNPDALPGWTQAASVENGKEIQGITLLGKEVSYSSPVVAEIDGNTSNGLETAVGTSDGTLSVYSSSGLLLWTANLPNKSCKFSGTTNKLLSSPAVGQLFGNGIPYVVVGYGGVTGNKCDGGVAAYRGSDGKKAWIFSTKKFAKKARFGANSHSVFSSPALADTDGDGKMEVGFGSFDRNVYLLEANGKPRWYYNAADTVWSSPTFADIDNDSKLEMIIGTDISGNSRLKPITKNGGYVYAFKTAKRKNKHIQFRDSTAYSWQAEFDQVIYSSPVVADVLDSPGKEIIVASGCFFPQGSSYKDGKSVTIIKASSGDILKSLAIDACSSSSVAVGDIDEDGKPEIVVTVNGAKAVGGDGSSRVKAFNPEDGSVLWSVIPYSKGSNDEYGGNFMSPVIADVDGNGSLEVIVANGKSVSILNGKDGQALTCQTKNCSDNPYILDTGGTIRSTPAIADINGDGVLDIVAASSAKKANGGGLFGWTNLQDYITTSPGTHPANFSPWPMYRGSASHSSP